VLYNTTDWTNVLYNVTLVTLLISLAVHIFPSFLTIPATNPILRTMS